MAVCETSNGPARNGGTEIRVVSYDDPGALARFAAKLQLGPEDAVVVMLAAGPNRAVNSAMAVKICNYLAAAHPDVPITLAMRVDDIELQREGVPFDQPERFSAVAPICAALSGVKPLVIAQRLCNSEIEARSTASGENLPPYTHLIGVVQSDMLARRLAYGITDGLSLRKGQRPAAHVVVHPDDMSCHTRAGELASFVFSSAMRISGVGLDNGLAAFSGLYRAVQRLKMAYVESDLRA